MHLSVPTEFVPAVLAAGAISAASLLGTFTFVVAQATVRGPEGRALVAKTDAPKPRPPTATGRAPQ